MKRGRLLAACLTVVLARGAITEAQRAPSGPPRDVEQTVEEAGRTPEEPLSLFGRPVYRAVQDFKRELNEKHGINFAVEDTLIYQRTSGGVDPNDAMVNTLGLFATWKIIREENGKDFGGLGFQAETRGDLLDDHFTAVRDSLGTLWSPNDSTSDDYTKINQFWWGQKFGEGRYGYMIGKIDPGSLINANRYAGSGNTQFFGQPLATNPARSFPDNGFGLQLRAEPLDWLNLHFTMSDSDAVSTYSPFKTLNGRWLYAGEVGFKPKLDGMGPGNYRLMIYSREIESADEIGWSVSIDQNLTEAYGIFLRYGGNDGGINAIQHIVAGGFSLLKPFGRVNDQAGVGASYTHPTDASLRDEYATELFYRVQVTEGFELSADVQLIFDPSASDHDCDAVFGLRARFLY